MPTWRVSTAAGPRTSPVGQKRAREIFSSVRPTAQEAYEMGMVNAVLHAARGNGVQPGQGNHDEEPMAIKMLKFAFNLIDGLVGQQVWQRRHASHTHRRSQGGRDAFLEKRPRDFTLPKFPEFRETSVSCDVAADGSFSCHDKAMLLCFADSMWIAPPKPKTKPLRVAYTLEVPEPLISRA